ncbi:hypothetical protein [Lentibacter sp. XHP0401]|uniref:hypothetical protein n=1 Tax=Lentibacter sp. XHP0401 TaxID=2984334 RepID=UPI0021E8BB24|nr:hypothetical protein [Lentibacter sp. XHP0401]MCV2894869.1 hypothetical protein [Lentibacter sp. XHP0401]
MNTHDPCDPQFTIRYYEKIGAPPSLTRPVPETTVAAESDPVEAGDGGRPYRPLRLSRERQYGEL